MSDAGHPHDGPGSDDAMLAAEFALGMLNADDRRRAVAREAADPAFAGEVAVWRDRLSPLLEEVPADPAPEALWARIEARLTSPVSAPANDQALAAGRTPAWRGFGWAGAGALAASLVWAIVLVGLRSPHPAAPMMVARLSASPGERPMWVATVDPLRRSIGMVPAEAARPDPRTRELWLIPADGRPRALGVFDPAHAVSMPMPDNLLGQAAPQVVLAVSLEPPGGSPTGKPSGPVIAKGELSAV